jgi:alpha-N-acetylglucosaminidase
LIPREHADPVKALVERVFTKGSSERVEIIYDAELAKTDGAFRLTDSEDGGILVITASDPSAACSAIHHYCFIWGECTVTWGQGRRVSFPEKIRTGQTTEVAKKRTLKYSYYLNFCTPSYTMAWWKWEHWERELDWAALHGVNLPLVISGREYVMFVLFLEHGMKEEEILRYFTGPAFLGWHRMGNLKSFGGPMPKAFLDHLFSLTKKVLHRARELGMKPVLPGFSGHVSDEFSNDSSSP